MKPFRIYRVDEGFARIVYKCKNGNGEWIYYCIAEDLNGSFDLFRCGQPPDCEPQWHARPKTSFMELFELPNEEGSKLEKRIGIFICNN